MGDNILVYFNNRKVAIIAEILMTESILVMFSRISLDK